MIETAAHLSNPQVSRYLVEREFDLSWCVRDEATGKRVFKGAHNKRECLAWIRDRYEMAHRNDPVRLNEKGEDIYE